MVGNGQRGRWSFGVSALRLFFGSSWHGVVLMLRDRARLRRVAIAMTLFGFLTSLIMSMLLRDWLWFIASNVFSTS